MRSRARIWLQRLSTSRHALWLIGTMSFLETLIVPIPIEVVLIPFMATNRDRIWLIVALLVVGIPCSTAFIAGKPRGSLRFIPVPAPGPEELQGLVQRIATGPREGQKVFTLRTIPTSPEGPRREVAESSVFSLHAGIAAKASQRDKLEHLARYVSRPAVATERLSLTEGGRAGALRTEDAVSGRHHTRDLRA